MRFLNILSKQIRCLKNFSLGKKATNSLITPKNSVREFFGIYEIFLTLLKVTWLIRFMEFFWDLLDLILISLPTTQPQDL